MTADERRSESQRLLGIASKLLETRDLAGAKGFATSAQDSDPLLDGSDQILAIADVLLAADNKVNGKVNWYAILQLSSRCNDLVLLKKQYRKLAILLHPDKNKYSYCCEAFKLVSDAWDVVSDSSRKAVYDKEVFGEIAVKLNDSKRKIRSGNVELKRDNVSFWTACPYCYNLHQYSRAYIGCVLKCNTCGKVIHAVEVPCLPSVVKGTDGFNCAWGCFPMGYAGGSGKGFGKEFPNWMPPIFQDVGNGNVNVSGGEGGGFGNLNVPEAGNLNVPEAGNLNVPEAGKGRKAKVTKVNGSAKADFRKLNVEPDEYVTRAPVYDVASVQKAGTRKRGRPRKNPIM
ncbi:uncharacterized protein LOC141692777 [Apium graveolens]|uniref:uncharacterized protein LOC141692777 n=1 Tax=Apium graveolens TaxID=4045 RepID=UPI003D7A6F9B